MKSNVVFIIIVLTIGAVFRMWFVSLFPQEFKFDQVEYQQYAVNILQHGIYASSARLYGYPIFIAGIYWLFGMYNVQAVYVFQAVLDSITALLVFYLASNVIKNKNAALIACLLYLFNPFTSAYVGVLLSEITGIFFTTLLLFLFIKAWKKQKIYFLILLPLVGGFLAQIRPVFLYFTSMLTFLTILKYIKKNQPLKIRVCNVILTVSFFFIPFLYTIIGNTTYFHEWKLTTVDRIPQRELYISVMVPDRAPVLIKNGWDIYPKEVMELYEEYSTKPSNKQERIAMAKKYFERAKIIILRDPLLFLQQRIGKMLFVWEKHTIFYYNENKYLFIPFVVYWVNMLLFFFAIIGLILKWITILQKKNDDYVIQGVYTFFLIYISVIHSVSFAEERYSLPGYPLLYLFVGYALWTIWKQWKKYVKSE